MMCHGKGCGTCKGTGWIEILGAGMVHPNVLEMAGYDSKRISRFRIRYGRRAYRNVEISVDDIRHFYTNDVRFLQQFKRA